MGSPIKAHHLAPRLATGLFILNSGLSKRDTDQETAEGLQDMASTAYPFLGELDEQEFADLLSKAEIAIGGTLLAPFVPTGLAGAALTGFASGLLGLYLRVPGMHQEGSLRPTDQGRAIAKDVWMLGIGLGFVIEALDRRSETT